MKIHTAPTPAQFAASLSSAAAARGLTIAKSPLAAATEEFVTYDPEMMEVVRCANILSAHNHPVLILGETGTGKELLARILHGNRNTAGAAANATSTRELQGLLRGYSTQRRDSFMAINCSGIPETLFESLVFGHKEGSFTGSTGDSLGLLRTAHNGTAFLDEVGDLPLSQQTKLLRALQTRRVRPVGDAVEYPITCRFVFATNKDLKAMIREGTFREDLYYRISTFVLRTKPLRDRPEDIRPIADRICKREGIGEPPAEIPREAYAAGNVRALNNWLLRREILGLDSAEALKDL